MSEAFNHTFGSGRTYTLIVEDDGDIDSNGRSVYIPHQLVRAISASGVELNDEQLCESEGVELEELNEICEQGGKAEFEKHHAAMMDEIAAKENEWVMKDMKENPHLYECYEPDPDEDWYKESRSLYEKMT